MLSPALDDFGRQAYSHEKSREGLGKVLTVWRAKAKPFWVLSQNARLKETPRKTKDFVKIYNPMIHVVLFPFLGIKHGSVPNLSRRDIGHVLCPRPIRGILVAFFLNALPVFPVF